MSELGVTLSVAACQLSVNGVVCPGRCGPGVQAFALWSPANTGAEKSLAPVACVTRKVNRPIRLRSVANIGQAFPLAQAGPRTSSTSPAYVPGHHPPLPELSVTLIR